VMMLDDFTTVPHSPLTHPRERAKGLDFLCTYMQFLQQ
jgi:hypothetical protein